MDILLACGRLSVPGGAKILTQMRANGVQQERKKKENVERRSDFPVYSPFYIRTWCTKISTWATKRFFLITRCFGIIKTRKLFGLPRPTFQTIFVSINAAITPGPQLGAWISNYLSFPNPLFIFVARIRHIVGLWLPNIVYGWNG